MLFAPSFTFILERKIQMKFLCKVSNQVLCIKPKRTQIIDNIPYPIDGEHVRFVNGEFETEDKKVIQFIKKHQFFGNSITEIEEVKAEKEQKVAGE